MIYFDLKSDAVYLTVNVKERQLIKPLQTCESYFWTFPKNIFGVSVIRFFLQKHDQIDTRFYPDTDEYSSHNYTHSQR